jgi:hypothetical protein
MRDLTFPEKDICRKLIGALLIYGYDVTEEELFTDAFINEFVIKHLESKTPDEISPPFRAAYETLLVKLKETNNEPRTN